MRRHLLCASMLAGLVWNVSSYAGNLNGTLVPSPVPPEPTQEEIARGTYALGNSLNNPITGAQEQGEVTGGERPPSLEALQAGRPGINPDSAASTLRGQALREAALSYGARGGLAARAFAINEMLRRHEAELDATYDFRALVVPLGAGQTLMRPPIVTEAQMAFALGDGGQVARESARVYRITRQAELTSAPPNWRTYLVRTWTNPTPPPDDLRPRTGDEATYWNKWVAEGWAKGERQAVEIFLSDLGRLERDIVGMARYRVLLRAGLVEQPRVAFAHRAVQGGHDVMRLDDRTIRITGQSGLNPNQRRWHGPAPDML
ncbi:MAG: type IV secretion system DotC family protein [Acetobacteraceae bacterium]|nr:type IV secretion system DotC family protein [Acetobacteraceae bacterium]